MQLPMVEYQGVHKAFDAPVLSGVDLSVESGETLAIIGPSGTGKSVLLKTTIGLIVPDAGDVRVAGMSVFSSRRTLERVRRQVGYVFQNAALFDSLSVFDNVAQGLSEAELRETSRRRLLPRVGRALELVNLDPAAVLTKLPAELSGGMRKRVGVARAIIGEPRLLLYDEPVTGLDPVNAAVVHGLIERLADELGVTSIVVTHDIPGALEIADRMALLEGGRVRFVGTTDEFRESDAPLVRAFLSDNRERAAEDARLLEMV